MDTQKLAVQIDDLTVAYNYKPVLWDIDLSVPEGVLMAIVGPNGAGKSTLIKTILGIIKPIAGTVSIYGKPYSKHWSALYIQIQANQIHCADSDEGSTSAGDAHTAPIFISLFMEFRLVRTDCLNFYKFVYGI